MPDKSAFSFRDPRIRMASSTRRVPTASELAVYSGVSNETRDVTLRGQIVDLVRLHLLDDPDEIRGVRQVSIVQFEADVLFMRILI